MTIQPPPVETGTPEGNQYTPEQTQAYISQLRDEAKRNRLAAEAANQKLSEILAKQEETEKEWLKEQGDFKALSERQSTELTQTKSELAATAAYKTAFQAALDARVKAIPESMRSLVPENMEPIALSAWLDKNEALLKPRTAPNLNPGASSNVDTTKEAEADPVELETARRMGFSAEQYRQIKGKYQPTG